MLKTIHSQKRVQLGIGFAAGILFGFLLQKGGVTTYDVIIGQLLFTDFTVMKIMLTAIVTGMIGIHFLRILGLAELHPKPGSIGSTVPGGLIFGVGFGILGYCPGTVAGAVGQGSLDALLGGVIGILLGAGIFSELFPMLNRNILNKGYFGEITWPQLLNVNPSAIIFPVALGILGVLYFLERAGL
jgi:uncharacterized protein